MDPSSNINVKSTITVTIKEHEFELNSEEARRLLTQLKYVLNEVDTPIYPSIPSYPIPGTNPPFPWNQPVIYGNTSTKKSPIFKYYE